MVIQKDIRTAEDAILLSDAIINYVASTKSTVRVIWGEIEMMKQWEKQQEKI